MAIVQDFQSAARYALPLFLAFSAYLLNWLLRCGRRQTNLPPGPPTIPILGNMLIFPKKHLHLQFADWSRKYGDIISLKVMNQTVIVLNSPSALKEVIDRRAASSSDRPASILSDMITPHNMNFGTGQYADETWKALRKAAGYVLNSTSLKKLATYQRAEATQLMWDISHTPDEWYSHIRRYTTSFVSGITYGKRSVMLTSPDVVDFLEVMPLFLDTLEIGTAPPVDLFPILTLVPERWAKWKRQVKRVKYLHEKLYGRLLENVEKRLENNMSNGCFMEDAIKNAKNWGLTSREHLLNLGGVLLEGSDTSSATLQSAILVLACYPKVQKKAQEEIDRVVGSDRAPEWEDIPNLPYTQAVIQENKQSVRFRPVGPLGLPHAMSKDEVINGQFFPKGAALFLNLWHILHDERYYDRPNEFIPERFLKHPQGVMPGVIDDPARRGNIVFGGGRRVCPGVQAANTSLEINVTNFLWAFEILPALDPITGGEIYPDLNDYTSGITATPKPAKLRIIPRTPAHKAIIDEQFAATEEAFTPYELEITEEERKFNEIHRRSF